MVVLFEVDACLPIRATPSRPRTPSSPAPATHTINKPTLRFPHVAVIRAGSPVPQSHLIELKTYSKAGKGWDNSYPQLFLSQTPHIYYGSHKGGKFSEIKKFALGDPHLEHIDQNAQVGFKKLKMALTTIQELVRRRGTGGRISLVCKGKELGVHQRQNAGGCLPKYALALFRS